MARLSCFSYLHVGRWRKSRNSLKAVESQMGDGYAVPGVMPDDSPYTCIEKDEKGNDPLSSPQETRYSFNENSAVGKVEEASYEGGDEHDEPLFMKRDFSDFDLQAFVTAENFDSSEFLMTKQERKSNDYVNQLRKAGEEPTSELTLQSGHVSDPGMARATSIWGSPILKRSCSNIETKGPSQLPLSPTKSQSYFDIQNITSKLEGGFLNGFQRNLSAASKCSADKVMLKKHSSSQVLPSRSRKLWWKLFLWSHRNLHKTWASRTQIIQSTNVTCKQKGGYSSDTHEPKSKNKKIIEEPENCCQPDLWPQNQWVAFSTGSSPLDRVNAWVNSLEDSPFLPFDDEDNDNEEREAAFSNTFEVGEPSDLNHGDAGKHLPEEILQSNNLIQSMNYLSTVAHISAMGLKVIPSISVFSSLRAVNLSGNFIVHINLGLLPKGLHALDLSKNKISKLEGLRELTKLRVLNLSYNRVSRIGHGLSNCTLIRELYLAGNKISDSEGLHRLLKLSVLDLSFNKITTTKALGQLVANYHSLRAINILGNPIQTNIGDDQLYQTMCGLLPKLLYLNKQPIKTQRVREVATDSIAKAALGNTGWNSCRRRSRRESLGSGSSSTHRGVSSSARRQKSTRLQSKSRHHYCPSTTRN